MNDFLALTEEDRRLLIAQASDRTGLTPQAIEKDWWITIVLRALFQLPMHEHFIFKGGTSLSKGWKLIERFSEDIDIALSPEAFGRSYIPEPSNNYVKNLKREGCIYTTTVIRDALEQELIAMGIPAGMFTVEAEAISPVKPDKDPQTLFVHFTSFYESDGYILDPVKVEFGVRSLREPFSSVQIISILGQEMKGSFYDEQSFQVMAVEPRKTFMEKMMLLHEKYQAGIQSKSAQRQSRHLYDLYNMSQKGIADEVLSDIALYKTLLKHRSHYVRIKGIEYNSMQLHTLSFIPPDDVLAFFRNDYETMITQMMYGDVVDFDTLMDGLQMLQARLKNGPPK